MKQPYLYRFLLIIAMAFLCPYFVRASHIVGGELNYRYVGKNVYEITLTVYRDCYRGVPDFDSPAFLDFFDSENKFLRTKLLFHSEPDTIPLDTLGPCKPNPTDICYEKAIYRDTVMLEPRPGGYQMSYKRCCWNISVTNIVNAPPSGTAGLAVYATIPEIGEFGVNSNPVFKNLSPPFNCLNSTLEFDHSATDPDGDSLSYHLFTPWHGDDTNIVGVHVPYPPDYDSLRYVDGFDLRNVMGSIGQPYLQIDPATGLMSVKTDLKGQFVFGIEVREYRKGTHFSSTWRSYQLNTVECVDGVSAGIGAADIFCDVKKVEFTNYSTGAQKYTWDFGDPARPGYRSQAQDTSYTYGANGTYVVTLIVTSEQDTITCRDTAYKEVNLVNNFEAEAYFDPPRCQNTVSFHGEATNFPGFYHKWYWDFGDTYTSNKKDPAHTFASVRKYKIKMTSQLHGLHERCVDSAFINFDAVDLLPDISVAANKKYMYKNADSVFLHASSNIGSAFSWKPVEGLSNPMIKNPVAKPKKTTTYVVTVYDTLGCVNKDTITIHVNPYRCGESEIFIPNAFTPNGDGENDFFRVRGEDIRELYFAVYNRWGELMFESTSTDMTQTNTAGWDGTYRGEKLPPGVFVYYVRAICMDDNEFIKKGNATLIR